MDITSPAGRQMQRIENREIQKNWNHTEKGGHHYLSRETSETNVKNWKQRDSEKGGQHYPSWETHAKELRAHRSEKGEHHYHNWKTHVKFVKSKDQKIESTEIRKSTDINTQAGRQM